MQSISNLRHYKIKFGINIVLSRYTESNLEEIVDFIKSIGVNSASFNLASPIVSRKEVVGSAVSDMKSYRHQVMETYHKCKKNGIKAKFLLTVPHCIFSDEEIRLLKESNSISSGCQVVHGTGIVFKNNGAIATCTHLSDFEIADSEESKKIIRSSSALEKFWNSEEVTNLRRMANCYRAVECQTCNHWISCGGGCLVHWAYHKPEDVGLTSLTL